MLESERKRVLSIERLVLETMCFKFGVDTGLGVVVKIGRAMECESWLSPVEGCVSDGCTVGKGLCQHAWRVAIDW